jgi:hypothetical protein
MPDFRIFPTALAIALAPVSALAEDVWSSAAMGCVPTSTTVAEARYVTTAGVVKFKDNATGLISFVCPVGALDNGRYYLSTWVRSSDAAIGAITVQLRARNMQDGATRTILETTAPSREGQTLFREVVSNVRNVNFADPFETYWVQISVRRQSRTAEAVSVLSVEIVEP